MKKTKIILVTGFLGAGKTTVMKNLVRYEGIPEGNRIGVIINEFGKVNVDAQTFTQPGLSVTEINNGSIFCKCLEGTFINHIVFLKEKKLDYLFIESSGLSDPSNMQSIMKQVDKISGDAFEYAGTLCIADAQYYLKLSGSLSTILRQVAAASMVIINKTDLASDLLIEQIIQHIQALNPFTYIHLTSFGKLPDSLFSILKGDPHTPVDIPSLNTPANRPDVILLTSESPMSENFIPELMDAFKGKLLRLKGFVRYPDATFHIDGVGDNYKREKINLKRKQSELVVIPIPGMIIRDKMASYLLTHSDWTFEVI